MNLQNLFINMKSFSLSDFWEKLRFWDKLYALFAIVMLVFIVTFIVKWILATPKKKLDFIVNAHKNGCFEVGKLSCLTVCGITRPQYYEAEYMYMVDGVQYFVTYNMLASIPIDERKEALNADMLLLTLPQFMILYYDKENPKKVYSKLEIFTSRDAIRKQKTPKTNVYRDVNRDWSEPIDMVQY